MGPKGYASRAEGRGLGERPDRHLRDVRLAEDDRPSLAQAAHNLGVAVLLGTVCRCTPRGHLASYIDVILDGDWDTEKRKPLTGVQTTLGLDRLSATPSPHTTRYALSDPSRRAMRSRYNPTRLGAVISPAANIRTCSAAPAKAVPSASIARNLTGGPRPARDPVAHSAHFSPGRTRRRGEYTCRMCSSVEGVHIPRYRAPCRRGLPASLLVAPITFVASRTAVTPPLERSGFVRVGKGRRPLVAVRRRDDNRNAGCRVGMAPKRDRRGHHGEFRSFGGGGWVGVCHADGAGVRAKQRGARAVTP